MIEVSGVFITLKYIPLWISQEQERLAAAEKEKLIIRLNLDKKVTAEFRQRIIDAIRSKASSAQIHESRLDAKKQEVFFVKSQ